MAIILDLPEDLILKILSLFSFAEISKLREVSSCFNRHCKLILNRGFRVLENDFKEIHRDVKTRLPKRLSLRRDHPLAHHADILSSIESRIAVLDLSIMRYTRDGQFCFFPGKILDELLEVKKKLIIHQKQPQQLRLDIITDLRDLTSLAIEYFNEHLLPLSKRNRLSEQSRFIHQRESYMCLNQLNIAKNDGYNPDVSSEFTICEDFSKDCHDAIFTRTRPWTADQSYSDSENRNLFEDEPNFTQSLVPFQKSVTLTAQLLVATRTEVRKLRKESIAIKELNTLLQNQLKLQNNRINKLESIVSNLQSKLSSNENPSTSSNMDETGDFSVHMKVQMWKPTSNENTLSSIDIELSPTLNTTSNITRQNPTVLDSDFEKKADSPETFASPPKKNKSSKSSYS